MRDETPLTPTALMITSTLPATQMPVPSQIIVPPPASPITSQAPVQGMTSTQINVRAEPSTASKVLGIIPANTSVEITGKDPGEHWWQINYAQGVNGKGWITAQYVTTTARPEVPVAGGNASNPDRGNVAIVQQQLNVRSGPGTDFNSLGTLNPQDVVELLGKDANGVWLQINFPAGAGPQGKGWVNAAFVQAHGVENLPIITETGRIVGTGTPTGVPPSPTPTIVPAWEDHDSADHPVASVDFASSGTQSFIYSGNLSSPQGDAEDWVAFKPFTSTVFASLECQGGTSLTIDMTENNLPVPLDLACGDQMKPIAVKADAAYLIHLRFMSSAGSLQYTNYVLTIKTRPL